MFRKIVCSTVVAAVLAIAPVSQVSAHEYRRDHGFGLGLLAAAVVGTAAVVGAVVSPPVVVAPQPVYAVPVYAPPPAVVYATPVYASPYPYYSYRR